MNNPDNTTHPSGRSHTVIYDHTTDVLMFDGFKFSGELMRQFTETPCGRMFRVVKRNDGGITVSQEQHPLSFAAPDMLAALREISGLTGVNDLPDAWKIARAAISKAEGAA